MSNLSAEKWSALWRNQTTTTLPSMFEENYDLNIADFWREVLDGNHQSIIDLACGNGALAWLANDLFSQQGQTTKVTGIDTANIDPFKVLNKDRKKFPMLDFIGNTAIEKLPFKDDSIDLAISQYGLEYSNLHESIPEISRVLKPKAKVGFILHNNESFLLKGSTISLDRHLQVLRKVKIHDLFFELDRLFGRSKDLEKIIAKPKIRKKMNAINAATLQIKDIMSDVKAGLEIERYSQSMFNAFSEESIRKGIDRKKAIHQAINHLQSYIDRIVDLKTAALSPAELGVLVNLIEKEGFTISENHPIAYKEHKNLGTAFIAHR